MTNDSRKSDRPIVPTKPQNKADLAADVVEERGLAKGNAHRATTFRTQSRVDVSSDLMRVREAAKKDRKMKFTALLHHVTVDRLRASFLALKRDASPGVDGMTWRAYQQDLEANLEDLHGRVHRGAYRASPTRRAYIPKADGRQRSLGLATLEDKIVQGAVVEVLNAVYENDFLGFSYGFRPGRGPHDALDALAVALRKKVSRVLDADIRGFFDTLDHGWLMRFVEHRIGDKRLLRLIRKWLTAGVVEDGERRRVQQGTPQGATLSPLLANVYLHYVLDLWVHQWRGRRARGDVFIVRYADDFVVAFEYESDAELFTAALRERLRTFGLELHPEKTRLIEFGRFAHRNRKQKGLGKPETFEYLGLVHICAETRAGKFLVKRSTSRRRMRDKLKEIREILHRRRHRPIPEQGRWLALVLRGYFGYHAVPTNIRAIGQFRRQVEIHWLHALRRRSQRHKLTWTRFRGIADRWLPKVRILHPWPERRFYAKT